MTTSEIAAPAPHWLTVLKAEADRTSMGVVANRVGYSRTSISLVLAGKYPGKTDRIAEAVMDKLVTAVDCPYLGESLPAEVCRQHATGPAPTHNPLKLAHWRTCRQCPQQPQ